MRTNARLCKRRGFAVWAAHLKALSGRSDAALASVADPGASGGVGSVSVALEPSSSGAGSLAQSRPTRSPDEATRANVTHRVASPVEKALHARIRADVGHPSENARRTAARRGWGAIVLWCAPRGVVTGGTGVLNMHLPHVRAGHCQYLRTRARVACVR